jgi:peroxiredoxin
MFFLALFFNGKINPTELSVGDKAKDFSLKNVDGKMVSLKQYNDVKGFIVIFTCNTCPYAIAYEDRIIELHKKYSPLGYPVVAINPNDPNVQPGDSYQKMKERASKKDFPFAYLQDETQETTKGYGATRTPHVFILDKSLTVKYIGAIDNNHQDAMKADKKYVDDAMEAIFSGKAIDPDFTKAIGCGIKWKGV